MAHATGIGGIFFRASDPEGLAAWYSRHLGLPVDGRGAILRSEGALIWSAFQENTDYFGPRGQSTMLNYRVDDLDGVLERLRAAGVPVEEQVVEEEQGRFCWAVDPEGNRFELWEPSEGSQ